MEYSRFERLVIGTTVLLVAMALAGSLAAGTIDLAEIVGQVALIGVAAAAVHWGRKAGTVAALVACLFYLVLRLPEIADGMSSTDLLLLVSRFAIYCLIGIVGGEIFARVKYVFAGSKDSDVIDDWSRVYNQRYMARALEQAVERHSRYQEPFSVVVIALSPSLTATRRPEQMRGVVRTVAGFLRDDVRMVDDVARMDDGRFVVLLPHTPGANTHLVADRLSAGLCQTLGAKSDCVTTTCLGAAEDPTAMREFTASVTYAEEEPADQPPSGA